MKKRKPIKDWQDKLIDLVEEEAYLMTGNKSKKHFSPNCKMNDILDLVRKTIRQLLEEQKQDLLEKMLKLRDLKKNEQRKSLDYWEGYTEAKTEDVLLLKKVGK